MAMDLEWVTPCVAEDVDWKTVAVMDDGGGSYDWSEVRFFWSPSARRFFWRYDSGCSCNYWGDMGNYVSDFEDGDRDAALKAVREFGEFLSNADDAAAAIRKIARTTKES